MSKSNYLENMLLDHILRGNSYPSPSSIYVALFLASPGEDDSGTEVATLSYHRKMITFSAPSSGSVHNTPEVIFDTATEDWGHIVAFGLYDYPVGGNLLYYGDLATPVDITNGDIFKFQAGSLIIEED